MGFSLAGYKFIDRLNTMAVGSCTWTSYDLWNETTEDTGKIVLHHDTYNLDFFVTRGFDDNDDEMIYVQPLSTIYSTYSFYNMPAATLITGEILSCSFASHPWLEDNVVQGRGNSDFYIVESADSVTWSAQVGVSNVKGVGTASLGSFGFIGDYRFAGGLPYDTEGQRPSALKNHFFTQDGTVQAIIGLAGTTHVFTAQSYDDLIKASPFVENNDIEARLFEIYLKDETTWAGALPDLYWLSSYRVTWENTDGITMFLPAETKGTMFRDGNRMDRWIVLSEPTEI